MSTNNNCGALVEINCETDFVSKNQKFYDLAEIVLSTILKHGMTIKSNANVSKTMLYTESLNGLSADDGKSLSDHSALTIGFIGENINIKRALCMTVQPGIHLYGCIHPSSINPVPPFFGRYGALLALKSETNNKMLGVQLCQHIIGKLYLFILLYYNSF